MLGQCEVAGEDRHVEVGLKRRDQVQRFEVGAGQEEGVGLCAFGERICGVCD